MIVTHDPEFILKTCDNIIRIEDGTIVEQYSLDTAEMGKLFDFFTYISDRK